MEISRRGLAYAVGRMIVVRLNSWPNAIPQLKILLHQPDHAKDRIFHIN
jgi:hypothetical protein